MSNHFTGLSLGPPLGDQRLDLCDLYAFQSPRDPGRTAIILNANPQADALHPDAIYRVNIDNDGDLLNDLAISYVFSQPQDGAQTFDVFVAKGQESRSVEAVGTQVVKGAEVSFGPTAKTVTAGDYTFFAGSRSDAFFFDYDGIKNLFDTSGGRTSPTSTWAASRHGPESTPTRRPTCSPPCSSCRPTSSWAAPPTCASGGVAACGATASSCTSTGPAIPRSRASSTPTTPNSSTTPASRSTTRRGWTDQFVHLMGHTGGYTPEEALQALDEHGVLPDVLTFDPSKPAVYPNGRVFTDDVINTRLAFLTKGECPPTGLSPHTDTLSEFPYIGNPHPSKS